MFVQNLRPGSLAKLGLGHEEMRSRNPRLVYCEMTGYGRTGPRADPPAYDPLDAGVRRADEPNGEAGRAPARIPASILDQGTGMWTAIAVMDALRTRERTGEGAHMHTSLLNTALMWLPSQLMGYFAAGAVPQRLGSGTVGIYPYAAFPTADNWVIIAAGNENLWQRLCGAIGREDLTRDPRFSATPIAWPTARSCSRSWPPHCAARAARSGSTASTRQGCRPLPSRPSPRSWRTSRSQAIGALPEVAHPRIADFRVVNLPMQIDGEYAAVRRVPPLLGEHNDEVLGAGCPPRAARRSHDRPGTRHPYRRPSRPRQTVERNPP